MRHGGASADLRICFTRLVCNLIGVYASREMQSGLGNWILCISDVCRPNSVPDVGVDWPNSVEVGHHAATVSILWRNLVSNRMSPFRKTC